MQDRKLTEASMIDPELNLVPDDVSNRELAANVHPAGWRNPTPVGRYNLVVLGAGTAGLVAAAGAAGLGAKVALVERHLMGGDCLNAGCVPSKAIIRSASAAHAVRTAPRFGVNSAGEPSVEFAEVMERMRSVRAGISPHDSALRFRDHYGVDVFFGDARFTGPDTIAVNGTDLRFARAVIATGTRAAVPIIDGLEEVGYLTNHNLFNLTEQPRRLAVIGCGPIGCELAQTFARLGTRVTLIEAADQLLPREDADASAVVEQSIRRDGVAVKLSTTPERVVAAEGAKLMALRSPAGEERLAVDQILVATGRKPNIEDLGLDAAGVDFETSGVKVDDYLQTSNRRIYASGDVCLPFKFTHTADAVSRAVIQNALFPWPKKRLSSLVIPWCTYTDPEIAHVGLAPIQAEARGIAIDTWEVAMADVDRAVTDGETEGFLKVHCRKGTDTILGATIVGGHAGDMISEITTAMVAGIGLGSFSGVIHPYPTRAEIIRKAADAYNRTKLTPTAASILKKWFRFKRRR
jgi:pyruvate/2-oxoglutarate dehydrogenase complex dihydrolipoamide dehydrogenase (E3) component